VLNKCAIDVCRPTSGNSNLLSESSLPPFPLERPIPPGRANPWDPAHFMMVQGGHQSVSKGTDGLLLKLLDFLLRGSSSHRGHQLSLRHGFAWLSRSVRKEM